MGIFYLFLIALAIVGVLMVRDGLRLLRHLRLADRLVLLGMSADDACRLAGCDFWEQPWYRRWNQPYPPVQLPEHLQLLYRD